MEDEPLDSEEILTAEEPLSGLKRGSAPPELFIGSGAMGCREALLDTCAREEWCRTALVVAAALQGHDEAHGLPHTIRTTCLALEIAREEGYDRLDLVIAASLLHDVGRGAEENLGVHHAIASGRLAEAILHGYMPEEDIRAVVRAVLAHSYSLGLRDHDMLSCIVSDADKLDALGAVGVVRAVIHGHSEGRPLTDTISHYYEKLRRLPSLLCLEASRRIAEKRIRFMEEFFKTLLSEVIEAEDAVAVLSAKAFEEARRLRITGDDRG